MNLFLSYIGVANGQSGCSKCVIWYTTTESHQYIMHRDTLKNLPVKFYPLQPPSVLIFVRQSNCVQGYYALYRTSLKTVH